MKDMQFALHLGTVQDVFSGLDFEQKAVSKSLVI